MDIGTGQVFIVNNAEIGQQSQQTSAPLQRDFEMPVATAAMPSEGAQASLCQAQAPLGPEARSQMCRLCATVTQLVVPIFHGEGLQNNLADKIHQHLPIQVSENDELPVVVCFQCTSTLLAWHELALCSVQADCVMRERFHLAHRQKRQQHSVQSSQTEVKDEKCSSEEPRACVRCEHCAGDFPDTCVRAHLLSAHAPLLFLCAECRLYRSRRDMISHMATHINKGTKMPDESIDEAKLDNKTSIPVVRIQRISCKVGSPSSAEGSPHLAPDDSILPAALQTVTANMSPLENRKPNNLDRDTNLTSDETIEPANDSIPTERQTVHEHSKETEKPDPPERLNDFSDHSDTENEFGTLPESVFDAIEDSQDARSNDDNQDVDTEKDEAKTPNTPRPCPLCNKQCTSLSGWYYHVKHSHGTNRNLTCERCNKVFVTKSELAVHSRSHAKAKTFQCRTCCSVFSSRPGRYIHEQTHSNERMHVCSRCPRAFRWRAQLNRHEARHDATKNHICPQCGRAFSVAFDLVRHIRAHNPGCHRCDICDATFKQKRYLKVHMENIHLTTALAKKTGKKHKKLAPTGADSSCDAVD